MKKLYLLARNFSTEVTECHISAYASSAAFFMILSLIPMLIVICSILPYTPVTEADLMEAVARFMPQKLVPVAVSTVSEVYDKSPAILSISALVTMWSAGKGMLAIIRGLNAIHRSYARYNYIIQRIRASVYTVLMVLLILISLVVGVFGESIAEIFAERMPEITVLNILFSQLKLVVIFILLCLFFILLFTFIPNKKLDWKTQVVGAVFVAVTWSGFSYAFSIYVRYFTGTSIYGSMTTIIFLMLWFYFAFYLLFLGALLSKFLMPATEFMITRISEKKIRHKSSRSRS